MSHLKQRMKHRTTFVTLSLVFGLFAATAMAKNVDGTIGTAASTGLSTELLGGIPAAAIELNINTFEQNYISIDLASPGVSTPIVPVQVEQVASGTFVDNDFSRHYLLSKLNVLIAVDTADGSWDWVGNTTPMSDNEFWTAIRWDPETGNTYATTCTSDRTGCYLYTVDMTDGRATQIARVGTPTEQWFPMEIAIDSKGRLFMINIGVDYKNWLARIDKETGAVTVIGDTGISPMYIQGVDFDRRDDTLYWAAMGNLAPAGGPQGQLYSVNTETGEPTFLGVLPNGGSEVWALSIATAPATGGDDVIFADGFESP